MIQMIAGVYGLSVKQPNGKTRVVAMGPESGPFSVSPEREAELVGKRLAKYVEQPQVEEEQFQVEEEQPLAETVEESTEIDAPIGFDETPPEDVADLRPLDELTAKELRELGAEYGLTFKANASKKAMIEAIAEAQAMEAEEDDGEPAPTFDASEAVQ